MHHEGAVQSTRTAMDNKKIKPIYEAGFFYNVKRGSVLIIQQHDFNLLLSVKTKSYLSVR